MPVLKYMLRLASKTALITLGGHKEHRGRIILLDVYGSQLTEAVTLDKRLHMKPCLYYTVQSKVLGLFSYVFEQA